MRLEVHPVVEADIPEIVEVFLIAYASDPIVPRIMYGLADTQIVSILGNYIRKKLERPGAKEIKIVDTVAGKIVGYASWVYPGSVPNTVDASQHEMPPGANVELATAFLNSIAYFKTKYLQDQMYFLGSLCVRQQFGEQGIQQIRTMLMAEALQDADREGAQIFHLTIPANKESYAKLGFRDLEELSLDFIDLGARGVRTTIAQIRDPQIAPAA